MSEKLRRLNAADIRGMKRREKIAMLTAYDFGTARLLDESGVDMLLVGDSLGSVIYGDEDTLSVTMDEMVRHTRAVAKGSSRAMVVGDMPFLSYQVSIEEAVRNAGRFIQEARAHAVKLEGGEAFADTVKAIVRAGIPVCGHIGLMPQNLRVMGQYRMFGKEKLEAEKLFEDAKAIENAGAFCLVLECVEKNLAQEISETVSIPTIGIGSGEGTDGQVLVIHDLLGLTHGYVPRFVKPTASLGPLVSDAVGDYIKRTKESHVPSH